MEFTCVLEGMIPNSFWVSMNSSRNTTNMQVCLSLSLSLSLFLLRRVGGVEPIPHAGRFPNPNTDNFHD